MRSPAFAGANSAQGFRLFCPGGARPPVQAMIAFIDEHRALHGVEPICRVLPIAPSTYHADAARRADLGKLPSRARRDITMKTEIRRVYEENFRVYGVRKVWRQLLREGIAVARCTVARLMRAMSLQGVVRGKTMRTTISNAAAPCPLDRVNRQFKAPRPNALWVSDFTYVATWAGFVYVAFVIDAFARRIVGWRVSRTAHAGFVLDALEQALHERRPVRGSGLVHHSGRGVQPGFKWSSQHLYEGVAMGTRKRRSDRAGRDSLRSPGRPGVAGREDRRRFWAAIAAGLASEAQLDVGQPFLALGEQMHGAEPHPHRQLGTLQDGAGDQRCLIAALSALQQLTPTDLTII